MERRRREGAAERRIGSIATALRSSSIATTLRSNATSAERAGRTEGAEGEGAEEFSVAAMRRGVPFGELWGEGPKFWGSADPENVQMREREREEAEKELDGRIDGLGLRTAVEDFAEFGYCIVHDAIPPELCDAACSLMMAGAASGLERSRGVIGQEGDLITKHGEYCELLLQPKVRAITEACCGRGCQLGQLLSSVRGRGNKGLAAHADFEGGDTFADPVSSAPVCDHLQVVFALDNDWTFESGPSFVVPHSFKEQRGPRAEDWERIQRDAVALTMPRGAIALWHGYTWHGSLPRSQDGHRVAAHLTMIRARPRPLQDFTIRDGMEDLAAGTTQPEAMRVLLGLDEAERRAAYAEVQNTVGLVGAGTGLGKKSKG